LTGQLPPPEEGKTIRIAVARFSHETCTFCPRPTTVEDWEFQRQPSRDILDTDSGYIGGIKTICEEYGGIEFVGITSPRSARGGSSGAGLLRRLL
jgi:microcystin degradation protein MlrC